jgi:hypothetical protein
LQEGSCTPRVASVGSGQAGDLPTVEEELRHAYDALASIDEK